MKNILTLEEISEIHSLCFQYNITSTYTINSDGSIDVDGNVNLSNGNLTELPLNFNRVTENFHCHGNKLTTLKGCPVYVGGNFDCEANQLKSLEYCPNIIEGTFVCSHNQLSSMYGAPKVINAYFDCSHNKLTSTEGFPLLDAYYPSAPFFGYNNYPDIVNEYIDIKEDAEMNLTTTIRNINTFIKYQDHYEVWKNGFNPDAFNELINEIADGLE